MNYTVGIDSGSTATKGILLADGVVTRRFLCPTPFRPADAIHEAWETLRAGLTETPFLTLTGYGRQLVDFANKQVTEISCHGLGARLLAPDTRTVIDIGGQDSKVIQLDAGGNLSDFLMNDKCAAGTGRFYEAMARSFEMTLPEFSNLSLTAKNVIPITAQCTVFAESEVITLVGEGKPMDEIAAGIQMAVAKRCFVMSKKAGATDAITLTGGCAKNAGLKQAIEHVLKLKVIDLKTDPQLMGALGAAEYARQKGMARA